MCGSSANQFLPLISTRLSVVQALKDEVDHAVKAKLKTL